MYGAWDALKNVDKVYPNHKLNWAAYVAGKRESRRLLGDVVLTKEDLAGQQGVPRRLRARRRGRSTCTCPTRSTKRASRATRSSRRRTSRPYKRPYWVPYRCLYSRNMPNLFMAGRDISVTHEALGAVRVMRTCGMMGEVVGMAAAICRRHHCDPRDVYGKYLDELKELLKRGAGKKAE